MRPKRSDSLTPSFIATCHDGRGSRLRRVTRLYLRALGSWAPLRSRQAADEAQTLRFSHRSLFALLHPKFREFSHGLQDFCRPQELS
jgi:hypothetical protein